MAYVQTSASATFWGASTFHNEPASMQPPTVHEALDTRHVAQIQVRNLAGFFAGFELAEIGQQYPYHPLTAIGNNPDKRSNAVPDSRVEYYSQCRVPAVDQVGSQKDSPSETISYAALVVENHLREGSFQSVNGYNDVAQSNASITGYRRAIVE